MPLTVDQVPLSQAAPRQKPDDFYTSEPKGYGVWRFLQLIDTGRNMIQGGLTASATGDDVGTALKEAAKYNRDYPSSKYFEALGAPKPTSTLGKIGMGAAGLVWGALIDPASWIGFVPGTAASRTTRALRLSEDVAKAIKQPVLHLVENPDSMARSVGEVITKFGRATGKPVRVPWLAEGVKPSEGMLAFAQKNAIGGLPKNVTDDAQKLAQNVLDAYGIGSTDITPAVPTQIRLGLKQKGITLPFDPLVPVRKTNPETGARSWGMEKWSTAKPKLVGAMKDAVTTPSYMRTPWQKVGAAAYGLGNNVGGGTKGFLTPETWGDEITHMAAAGDEMGRKLIPLGAEAGARMAPLKQAQTINMLHRMEAGKPMMLWAVKDGVLTRVDSAAQLPGILGLPAEQVAGMSIADLKALAEAGNEGARSLYGSMQGMYRAATVLYPKLGVMDGLDYASMGSQARQAMKGIDVSNLGTAIEQLNAIGKPIAWKVMMSSAPTTAERSALGGMMRFMNAAEPALAKSSTTFDAMQMQQRMGTGYWTHPGMPGGASPLGGRAAESVYTPKQRTLVGTTKSLMGEHPAMYRNYGPPPKLSAAMTEGMVPQAVKDARQTADFMAKRTVQHQIAELVTRAKQSAEAGTLYKALMKGDAKVPGVEPLAVAIPPDLAVGELEHALINANVPVPNNLDDLVAQAKRLGIDIGKYSPGYTSVRKLARESNLTSEILQRMGIPGNKDAFVENFMVPHIQRIMKLYQNPYEVLKVYDHFLTIWKRWALGSPSTVVRNGAGNLIQMHVGGMDMISDPSVWEVLPDTFKSLAGSRSPERMAKYGDELIQLGGQKMKVRDYVDFVNSQGVLDSGPNVGELGPDMLERAMPGKIRGAVSTTRDILAARKGPLGFLMKSFGDVENMSKLWAFTWAINKGMTPEAARRFAFKTLLDYRFGLTDFERNVLRRIFPFYSWLRLNLPAQLRGLIRDPGAYSRLQQIRGEIESMSDSKTKHNMLKEWMRDKMPVLFGNTALVAESYLPQADLGKIPLFPDTQGLKKTGNTMLEMMSPLLKVPVEQLLNYSSFTQQPITQPGRESKPMALPFLPLMGMNKMPARLEHLSTLIRPLRDIQRLNPGGIYGSSKQILRAGGWKPASPVLNWMNYLLAMPRPYSVDPGRLWLSKMAELSSDIKRVKSDIQYRKGQGVDVTDDLKTLADLQAQKDNFIRMKVKYQMPTVPKKR